MSMPCSDARCVRVAAPGGRVWLGSGRMHGHGQARNRDGWSGNLEFMTPENSCLVNYHLVPVGDDEYPHAAGAQWAEADVGHAAALMKRLVDEPGFAEASVPRRRRIFATNCRLRRWPRK